MFIDETGLYLLPAIVRTWAPRGQTPIIRSPLTRDHWSIIGAITPTGKLFFQRYPHAISGEQVVVFLRHLLRHLAGKLLIIWDGLPAHHGQAVKDFLSAGAAARIHLQRLPGYAPDLNPEEGIWRYLKRVELTIAKRSAISASTNLRAISFATSKLSFVTTYLNVNTPKWAGENISNLPEASIFRSA